MKLNLAWFVGFAPADSPQGCNFGAHRRSHSSRPGAGGTNSHPYRPRSPRCLLRQVSRLPILCRLIPNLIPTYGSNTLNHGSAWYKSFPLFFST